MLSSLVAPRLAAQGVHYSWLIVAITFFTIIATAATIGLPGVLLVPLREEFGWDTSAISGALALRLLMFGLMGPFGAAIMQRYGLRSSVCAALAMIALGLGLTTRMTELWQLWATWGVLVGLGTGMTAVVFAASVTSRWFAVRRGFVMGVLTAAAAAGQLVFLPLAAWLATQWGWRAAVLVPIAACTLAGVLMILFAVDRPDAIGLQPYGASLRPDHPSPSPRARGAIQALRAAAGLRAFWVLFVSFAICGFTTNGLVQSHFIPLCGDFGIAAISAAGVLALMGMCDFFGTIGAGWLSDRFNPTRLLFTFYALRGTALLILPLTSFSLYGLSVFAVFYGLGWIATVPPTVRLVTNTVGTEHTAVTFGWIFTAHQLGAAGGAFSAGLSRDLLATYLPAFNGGGVLCMVAALLVLLWRAPAGRDQPA